VPDTYDGLKAEALAIGTRLLARYPQLEESTRLLAAIHFETGNLSEATRCWEQWMKHDPNSAEGHYRLGLYARQEGRDQEAANHLRIAFRLDPTLPDIQARLGRALLNFDQTEEALKVLEPDIGVNRGGAVRYSTLGHALLRTQQHEKAKQAFLRAVEMAPAYTGAYYGLATACAQMGQDAESERYLEQFRKLKAQDAERSRDRAKRDDSGRMRPLVARWYGTAGRVYARQRDLEQAESHWLRAAAIHPADTDSRRDRIELYRRQGKAPDAARVAAELQEIVSRPAAAQEGNPPGSGDADR
jgi:tetratricopeptide (TPR) repeat protein